MDVPSKNLPWLQWVLGVAGIGLGIAAASLMFSHRTPAVTPHLSSAVPPAVYVQHEGGALRLHWNPAVRASSGVMWIQDGARETRLDLNANELRSGVASYWPESREVTFRLQLDDGPASTIRASADAPPPAPPPMTEKPRRNRSAVKEWKVACRGPVDVEDDAAPKRSRLSRVAGRFRCCAGFESINECPVRLIESLNSRT